MGVMFMKLILKTGKKFLPLFFLLLFGFTCLLIFFNSDQITEKAKTALIQVLEDQFAEQIEIEKVTLFPLNRITLHQVKIGTGSEPMIEAERIVISFYLHHLLKGVDGIVSGIKDIRLVEPQISVVKNEAGYSFEKYFSQNSDSQGIAFSSVIYIDDGSLLYRDEKLNESLEKINGRVEIGQKEIKIKLKSQLTTLKEANFLVEGTITPEMNLKISFFDLPFAGLEKYGLTSPEIKRFSGHGDGSITLKERLLDGGVELDYFGQMRITNGSIELTEPDMVINELYGQITINRDYLVIQSLAGEILAGKFTVEGQISDLTDPKLSLILNTDGIQIEKLLPFLPISQDLEVSGLIRGRAEVVGNLNQLSVKGKLTSPELIYRGLQMHDILLEGRLQNSKLTLQQLKINVDEGSLLITGGHVDYENLAEIDYSMTVDAQSLDLQRILSATDFSELIEGKLTARVYLSGEGLAHDQVTAIGSLEVKDGNYQEMPVDNLSASFWLTSGNLGLSKLVLATPYLTTELFGNVDLGGLIDLTVEPSYINLAWLGEKFDLPVAGQGSMKGQIGGQLANPYFAGEVSIEDGYLWDRQFDYLTGGLKLDKSNLSLTKAAVGKDAHRLELAGNIGFGNQALDLEVDVLQSSLQGLQDILQLTELPFELTGEITGQIALGGSFNKPRITGNLLATDGQALEQPYDRAELSFIWNDDDLFFNKFQVSYQNTTLLTSGRLTDYQTLDIEISGENFDLKDIQQISQHLPQISGQADFRGKLTGDISDPSFWGTISTDSIRYYDIPIEQLSALLNFRDGVLSIRPMKVINAESEYTLNGEISFIENTLELEIDNKHSRLTDLLRYTGLPVKEMDYTVGGKIWVKGELTKPFLEFDIALADGKEGELGLTGIYDLKDGMNFLIKGTNFDLSSSKAYIGLDKFGYTLDGQASLKGTLEDLNIETDIILNDLGDGQLAISGSYDLVTGMDLNLKGQRFDFLALKPLIPLDFDYTGLLDITGRIKGQVKILNADLKIAVTEGSLNGYPLKSFGGTLLLKEGVRLNLDQSLVLLDGNRIDVSGFIPLTDLDQEIDLKIDMPKGNLAVLPFLVPEVIKAGGQGDARLELTGSLKKPQLAGKINLVDGFIESTEIDLVEDITGSILIDQGRIVIDDLWAKYGPGQVELAGEISLDGLWPKEFDLTGKVKDFYLNHGSVSAMGDGDVQITGELLTPEIRGSLVIHDTTVKVLPTFDWPGSDEPSAFAPTFYLELFPGDNVRVIGDSPLNMNVTILKNINDKLDETASMLVIDTTGEELIITGDLSSRSGTFNIYNSNFRITRASASFVEFNKTIPILNIHAQTVIDDYRIFVELDGLPTDSENLDWELTSEPELTQEQITALLAGQGGLGEFLQGDGDVTSMISDEIWRYVNQGLRSEFLNKLEESIEKALQLDSFYLDTELWGDTKINLQIGKYLEDNFYFIYKRTFSQNPEQSFGFEYQIRPNISVEGVYKDEGEYQVSLKANFPF